MKRCVSCRTELPALEFNVKRASPDGLQNVCRECNRRRARRYYSENREHHLKVVVARTAEARRRALRAVGDHLAAQRLALGADGRRRSA